MSADARRGPDHMGDCQPVLYLVDGEQPLPGRCWVRSGILNGGCWGHKDWRELVGCGKEQKYEDREDGEEGINPPNI